MRDFHSSVNESDLVNRLDLWRESTVNAEDFSFDDGADTEVVENFCAVLPWVGIAILSNGLVVEPVDCGDLSGFVVSSQQGDVGWVLQLQAKKQLECLN